MGPTTPYTNNDNKNPSVQGWLTGSLAVRKDNPVPPCKGVLWKQQSWDKNLSAAYFTI